MIQFLVCSENLQNNCDIARFQSPLFKLSQFNNMSASAKTDDQCTVAIICNKRRIL